MKVSTIIHRDWPAEEEADAVALQLHLEQELQRTEAARDLQRSLHDLEFTAELAGLEPSAHQHVTSAISALRAAVRDQTGSVPA